MRVLITGGAGFIGVNAAYHYLERGDDVCVLDNLHRKGADINLQWLHSQYDRVDFAPVSVCDFGELRGTVDRFGPDFVLHLAGQVAVTTSVENPRQDFELNALGTFNLLEALRTTDTIVPIVYASTNKVYGRMETIDVVEEDTRYTYAPPRQHIAEDVPLDFHSPYGCSKGAADQYMRDYYRIYGIPSVVMRQSCIYGEHQFGIEDQGWVAWFTIATMLKRPITIFGNGKQVRDVLYVGDLLRAYDAAYHNIDTAAGGIYNIGGGEKHSWSLRELLSLLSEKYGEKTDITYVDWRAGDQYIYVSDISKAERELGWKPSVALDEGLNSLCGWIQANRKPLEHVLST